MRSLQIFVLLAILALATGCFGKIGKFRTLNKSYKETDLVFEEALLGKWTISYTGIEFNFSKDKKDGYYYYRLELTKKGKTVFTKAFLSKLEENYFLDIYPEENSSTADNDFMSELFHYVIKIDFNDDTPAITPFNKKTKWLSEEDVKGVNPLFSVVGNLLYIPKQLIVTTTDIIRVFLIEHGNDDRAFPKKNRIKLKRITEEDKRLSLQSIDNELDDFLK
ncbi:MAG: hypothetical protein ISR98_00875 [Parcubacteria group bacterium]|nr:hypothetical protein [Parcubacteria group bacterium]